MPFRYCRKDLQGNIIALIDNSGNTVVQYNYDAWGNHKVVDANGNEITDSTHIGNLNPFRYRSYYFDVETGLYYLQTRYYDPEGGRFISQDSIEYANPEVLNGINLYSYCGNNPVMGYDPDGTWSWTGFFNVVAAVAVVVAVTAAVALTAGAAAFAVGASTAVITTVTAGAVVGGAVIGGLEIANQIEENGIEDIDVGRVATQTFMGSVTGAGIGFGIGKFIAGGAAALSGGAFAFAGGGTVSVGATLAKAGIGLLGLGILFSKNADRYGSSKIGSNQRFNKQFSDFCNARGIRDKNIIRKFHDFITKKGYDTWSQLEKALSEFLKRR